MYEECIVKKNVLSLEESQELASFFFEKSKTCNPAKCIRGRYCENRLTFLAVDYLDKRTKWFEKVADLRTRVAAAFDFSDTEYDESLTWISIFNPPCKLPLHVDPPVKNRIRLILLLQKPIAGGEVMLSQSEYGETTLLPLEAGDAYLLPAHKYFHGVTFFDSEPSRIAIGLDYKIKH